MHEALELERQRICFRRRQLDPFHHVGQLSAGARLPAGSHPHELTTAGGKIEREVAVGLKEAEPADPFARHPRGGGQCYGAVGELDSGVGDVQVRREDRQPRGPNLGGHAAGEMQHQVEVVDHQVEHHRDVGSPRLERGQPQALDVARPIEVGLRRPNRPVVALDVPDLKLDPPPRWPRRSGRRLRPASPPAASP